MKWNLRLAAASRGIWKASELQRMLAGRDLVISAGKMSGLWSGDPASIKLSDLDVICAVLGCGAGELLIPGPGKVSSGTGQEGQAAVAAAGPPKVTPRRRDGRSLPPPDGGPEGLQLRRLPSLGRAQRAPLQLVPGLAAQASRRGRVRRLPEDPGGQGRLLPAVLAAGPLPVQARGRALPDPGGQWAVTN